MITESFSRNTMVYKLIKLLGEPSSRYKSAGFARIGFNKEGYIINIFGMKNPSCVRIRLSKIHHSYGYTHEVTNIDKFNDVGFEFIDFLIQKYNEIEDTVNQLEKSRIENFEEVKYNTERFKDYCEVYINGNNIHLSTKYSNLSELLEDIKIFREIFPNYQYSFFTKNIHINTITKSIEIESDDLINVYLTSDVSISYNPKKCTPYNLITSNKDDYKITLNQTKD